ncbi:hypothetical protein NE237_028478 [Protea cynaroides]|uniref:DUF7054 domain-containing protein n=1 Tax=Protea cynaroides TaxID=273540 RepID=A0A9Q0JTV9_9MAGN|nr:hypothetical protein NE237_028478 [Protea cynaroides]
MPARLMKLLLKVTIQRSLGAIQVVMLSESVVGDLIAAAVRLYAKEGRRPLLPSTDPAGFDLHYSQFSLENKEFKNRYFHALEIFGFDGYFSNLHFNEEESKIWRMKFRNI